MDYFHIYHISLLTRRLQGDALSYIVTLMFSYYLLIQHRSVFSILTSQPTLNPLTLFCELSCSYSCT